MALTEHEQKMLEQLEKQFKEDDPKFAEAMEVDPVPRHSVARTVAGVMTVLAGFALVLLGASLTGVITNITVGALGFVIMVAGAYTALLRTRSGPGAPAADNAPHAKKPPEDKNQDKDRRFFKNGFGDLAFWSLFWWV